MEVLRGKEMSGVIAYFLLLGGVFGLAIGLYYVLRTAKLI